MPNDNIIFLYLDVWLSGLFYKDIFKIVLLKQ